MYGKIFNEHIDYKNFLSYELDIWCWVLGFRLHLGQRFCNPMRNDNHAGVWLEQYKGRIVLVDFGDRTFLNMTVFDAVMYTYGIDFKQALDKISREFKITNNIVKHRTKSKPFNFYLSYIPWQVNGKDVFVEHDRDYWSQYGINSSQLEEDNVKSCKAIQYNTKSSPDSLRLYETSPSYAIHVNNHIKCYNPYSQPKWLSTCTEQDVGAYDKLKDSDTLIITKSYKDCRVLRNAGYESVWLQNEGVSLPFEYLIKFQQYNNKFILFDNDEAGIKAGKELATFANSFDNSYHHVYLEQGLPKDPADFVHNYSEQALAIELLNLGIK